MGVEFGGYYANHARERNGMSNKLVNHGTRMRLALDLILRPHNLMLPSLSATPIAGERPPPTTSQPPPPSSQRSPSTAPTQDLLADRASQHCSTQPAPSAQRPAGRHHACKSHPPPPSVPRNSQIAPSMPGPPTHPGPLDSLLQNAEKTEENSNAAWRKHRSSHLSSPFLNVQPPSPASPSASVAQPLSRRCHFCSIASALQSCPPRLSFETTVAGLAFCLRRAATVSTVPVLFHRVSPSDGGGSKGKFKALAIADDRDRVKELQKEIEAEAKEKHGGDRDRKIHGEDGHRERDRDRKDRRDRRDRYDKYDRDERHRDRNRDRDRDNDDYDDEKGDSRRRGRDRENDRDRNKDKDRYERRRRDGCEEENGGYGEEDDGGDRRVRRDLRHSGGGEVELYKANFNKVSAHT
ncbi:hypothetical protein Ahy_A03g013605 [Arachis hypogaea]|uniref:Uncharacterized protein n=1 Tax=Arachis hypogaea TaxID=3818 RepID=A0A445DVT4_ARAHY|nr:hypothetical protein Ahy_A03g013605 [Arachis hypogaea]